MTWPAALGLVLDLASGAGGAARGYADAGCEVIGADLHPQKNFPYEFVQADLLEILNDLLFTGRFRARTASGKYLVLRWQHISLIHVSPPCQRWSRQLACRPELAQTYPDLITPARLLLRKLNKLYGIHWVIENVPEAPLVNPVMLCGTMFGRELYRHRHFESSFPLPQPEHPRHVIPASRAGHWVPGTIMSVAGHIAPIAHARHIMGIDWTNREELAEAIPPDYTRWVAENSPLKVKENERAE